MLKAVAAAALFAGSFAVAAAADVRPSRGYLIGQQTRLSPPQMCYNIDCSSNFNTGAVAAPQHAFAAASELRREQNRSVRIRGSDTLPDMFSGAQRASRASAGYMPTERFASIRAATLRQTQSRVAYEFGFYPTAFYLSATSYCDVPTLAEHTPLCMGGSWPYYSAFLNPVNNPVFSGPN